MIRLLWNWFCMSCSPSISPQVPDIQNPPKGGKTQLIFYLSLCFWTSLQKLFVSLFYGYLNFLSACFFVFFYFLISLYVYSFCLPLSAVPFSSFLLFFSFSFPLFSFFIFNGRDFILPLFIHEADTMEEISSMPNCFRHSAASMLAEVEEALR